MADFIRDFNKRVDEIEKYFELVDKIEQLGAFTSNSIQSDNLTYQDLKPNIQKIWIRNDLTKSYQDRYITKDTIATNLENTLKTVLDNSPVFLDANNIPISGNLNAEVINKLIEMYGFYGNLGISKREIEPILDKIVKMRCDLAHGNVSFTEASNQKAWNDIVNMKDKSIIYLTNLLHNIENYINNKNYRI